METDGSIHEQLQFNGKNLETADSIHDQQKWNREQENENVAKSCQIVTIRKRDHFGNSRFAYKTNAFFLTFLPWSRFVSLRGSHDFITFSNPLSVSQRTQFHYFCPRSWWLWIRFFNFRIHDQLTLTDWLTRMCMYVCTEGRANRANQICYR